MVVMKGVWDACDDGGGGRGVVAVVDVVEVMFMMRMVIGKKNTISRSAFENRTLMWMNSKL